MYDLIIKDGQIFDGTGAPGYPADVAIKDGKIAAVGTVCAAAERIIEAKGLAVTPGFIDSHGHADGKILFCPEQEEKICQGITTSVAGQCGTAAAPENPEDTRQARDRITKFGRYGDLCRSMPAFLDALKEAPLGANLVMFAGHGALRRAVMGNEDRRPTPAELETMKSLLREAFDHGAGGLSFGLFYAPGCYAHTDEVMALSKVAAEYGRPVSAHIRNESDTLVEAVEEFIAVIRASGARGILSHHKAVRKRNWGKVAITLELLQRAVDEGLDIYSDTYPYCASSTTFSQAFVPKAWRAGGTDALLERIRDPELCRANKEAYLEKEGPDMSWVLVTSCAGYPQYQGLRLDEIARLHGKDGFDTAMDLILESRDGCSACFFSTCEEDLARVMAWERTMICTDSGMAYTQKNFHPRMVGSFPRALGRYVREKQVVCLPEMIRKMTGLPAHVYGLTTKGLLKEGYDADICIFDPERIIDRAEFTDCHRKAEGLAWVILAGQVAAENAVQTPAMGGRLLI